MALMCIFIFSQRNLTLNLQSKKHSHLFTRQRFHKHLICPRGEKNLQTEATHWLRNIRPTPNYYIILWLPQEIYSSKH